MKIKIYHISIGLESKFNFFSRFWYYRSKLANWQILRIFGIYFWIYPRWHEISLFKKHKN